MLPRWAPRLPKNPESPSDGTWLEQDFEHQGGVGCAICLFRAAVPNPFSLFRVKTLRMSIYLKHHQSKAHRHACQKFLRARADPTYGSPSRDQFKVVYDNVLKGHSLNSMTQSSRPKAKRMTWALAEPKRKTKRLALAKAAVIVWHSDGRSPRYLLRASACSPTPDFQITHTYIGHTTSPRF